MITVFIRKSQPFSGDASAPKCLFQSWMHALMTISWIQSYTAGATDNLACRKVSVEGY